MNLKQLLIDGAAEIGVSLTNEQTEMFFSYMEMLLDWNTRMNLTAITDEREIVLKHFVDSLSVLPYLEITQETKCIDVGTGAGFPGIPLQIANPVGQMTLLDSLNKRLNFLQEVVQTLPLTNVVCIHERAEDGAKKTELREQFDVALSRAVARLNKLSEYCLPYVKVGGVFVAMKGPDVTDELNEAKKHIGILGAEILDVKLVNIPETDITHSLVILKKVRQTPSTFPRNAAQMAKIYKK